MASESTIYPLKTSFLEGLWSGEAIEMGAKEIEQLFEKLQCAQVEDFQSSLWIL